MTDATPTAPAESMLQAWQERWIKNIGIEAVVDERQFDDLVTLVAAHAAQAVAEWAPKVKALCEYDCDSADPDTTLPCAACTLAAQLRAGQPGQEAGS